MGNLTTNGTDPMAAHDAGKNMPVGSSRLAWGTAIAIIYLLTLATWVPWLRGYLPDQLDRSWQIVLKWAFLRHRDFGHKLVFTYGPWGFAITGYDPQTFNAQVAVWTLLSAAFTAGLVKLVRHFSLRLRPALSVMMFVAALVGSTWYEFIDLRPFTLAWLLLMLGLYVDGRPIGFTRILLVVALALASQMKFTISVMAIGVLLALTIHAGRKIPWLAIIYTAAYLFFWMLGGQRLSSLPAYLVHSLHIISVYGDIEAKFAPYEAGSVVLCLAGCTAILALLLAAHWKQRRLLATSLGAVGFGLFMLFKAGFVRHDGHEFEATGGVAIISVLLAIAIWNRRRWRLKSLIAGVVLFNLGVLWRSYAAFNAGSLPFQLAIPFLGFPANTFAAIAWMSGDAAQMQSLHQDRGALLSVDLPDIHGRVDIYSWGQDMLLTRGWDYQPRPVFQSYLAESPYLAELNAQHLRGPDAPDAILFRPDTIDKQLPSFSDATSWPEILSRYQLADASKPWLLYRHADAGQSFTITRGPMIIGKLGQPIDLPADDSLIWARIDLHLTRFGQINHLLYKSPKLTLMMTTGNGQQQAFRFIPPIARAGFLLSPLVTEPMSFALLQSSTWQEQLAGLKVKRITIICDQSGPPPCYTDEFACSFDRLCIPARAVAAVPGMKH